MEREAERSVAGAESSVEVYLVYPKDSSWPLGIFSEYKIAEAIVEDLGTDETWTCSWKIDEGIASFLVGWKLWEVDFHENGLVESELSGIAWAPDEGMWFTVDVEDEEQKEKIIRARVWAPNQLESFERASVLHERALKMLKKRAAAA